MRKLRTLLSQNSCTNTRPLFYDWSYDMGSLYTNLSKYPPHLTVLSLPDCSKGHLTRVDPLHLYESALHWSISYLRVFRTAKKKNEAHSVLKLPYWDSHNKRLSSVWPSCLQIPFPPALSRCQTWPNLSTKRQHRKVRRKHGSRNKPWVIFLYFSWLHRG